MSLHTAHGSLTLRGLAPWLWLVFLLALLFTAIRRLNGVIGPRYGTTTRSSSDEGLVPQ